MSARITMRRAELRDVEPIVQLWLQKKREGIYATIPMDFERARKSIRQCISAPQAFARVVVNEHGRMLGVLLGLKEELWFSGRCEAKELMLEAEDAEVAQALVSEFSAWALRDQRVVNVLVARDDSSLVGEALLHGRFSREGSVFCLSRWEASAEVA